MSASDTNDPNWFFRLDDLDLLEFAYQSVVNAHHPNKDHRATEEKVLAEQEALEVRSEAELEAVLGDAPLSGECPVHHHGEEASIEELLTSGVREHPLTARAYRFFRALASTLEGVEASVCYEDLFRVKANAPLIPAKICFAVIELEHHDVSSVLIAKKELEVAMIYLRQLLASLEVLRCEEVLSAEQAEAFFDEGEGLLMVIEREYKRL